jgi:hypothetical protein
MMVVFSGFIAPALIGALVSWMDHFEALFFFLMDGH